MSSLGYTQLRTQTGLTTYEPAKHARLWAVTRVSEVPNGVLVPAQVANKTQTLLDHVFFALHHEGVNMQNKGKVSANQRKKFAGTVQAAVFDAMQDEWQRLFAAVE